MGGSGGSGGGLALGGSGGATASGGSGGMVVYGNPLAGNPQVRLISGNRSFGQPEGPLWIEEGAYLLFSAVNDSRIWKVEPDKPDAMRFSQFAYKNTRTNGLALDPEGNLLVCERTTGKVGKRKLPDGPISYVAEEFDGKRLKAPNDIVAGKNGNIYFTDPRWDSGSDLPESAYRIDTQGMLHRITTGTAKPANPNGIALSPDETALYVGDDGDGGGIWKYDVNADGVTSNPRILTTTQKPDGIAIDRAGNLYVASNSALRQIVVFRPDGSKLGEISVPAQPSNASFGGVEGKTLFITAGTGLYAVDLAVPGLP
ncbi:MAG: SMP-30/gluconolactonase/LRE family protein [Myxococcales bacterium]|nr:SMP-30/gluconolactonase/LRE family protein [Myxococcales bacterium]